VHAVPTTPPLLQHVCSVRKEGQGSERALQSSSFKFCGRRLTCSAGSKTKRALEILSVQQPDGKLTPGVDEQPTEPSDSNDGSADESTVQSRSRINVAKERTRHASPETVEREYRAEEKLVIRAMDTKGRNEFKPRAIRSEFHSQVPTSLLLSGYRMESL
jgi:hypothetical protein